MARPKKVVVKAPVEVPETVVVEQVEEVVVTESEEVVEDKITRVSQYILDHADDEPYIYIPEPKPETTEFDYWWETVAVKKVRHDVSPNRIYNVCATAVGVENWKTLIDVRKSIKDNCETIYTA